MRTAGFVLVGGQSARMGRDKARLRLASGLLVESVAAKVKRAAGSVCLVGGAGRYDDLAFEHIADLRQSCGPVAGIEAALTASQAEFNLILACDMPGVHEGWLAHLLAEAQRRNSACLISEDREGRLHPLCGVWHPEALPHVRRALDAGCLRVLDLISRLNAESLISPNTLANVNTPEEWKAWELAR